MQIVLCLCFADKIVPVATISNCDEQPFTLLFYRHFSGTAMAQLGEDERYWLEANWTRMSRSVLHIVVPLMNDAVEEIIAHGAPDPALWRRVVERSARSLDKVRTAIAASERNLGGYPPRSAMYGSAISLFGDADPIRDELIRAGERLAGKNGAAVTWACVRSGLYRMRIRATAEVENRGRTWQRLQTIVSEVREKAGWSARFDDPRALYTDDFCERVALYVREHHPADHNLPRDSDGVKGFFAEFCDDFLEPDDIDAIDEEDIELLPDLKRGYAMLGECVQALEPPLDEIYNVSLHRGDTTVSAYCLSKGLDRRKFHHMRVRAETQLKDCVTGKLHARMMALRS